MPHYFKAKYAELTIQRLRLVFFVTMFCSTSIAAFGWGRTGHHIIADVAQSIVNQSTNDSITKYLSNETWQAASVWMDELRGNSQFDYMRKWHFVNMEQNVAYSPAIENGDNVVNQLDVAIRNLKNRRNLTPDQVTLNIKVLFHLMGDLHNPLHVGYGYDRGGNDVKVIYNEKTFSLHRIWDTEIIEAKQTTRSDIMERLQKTKKRKLKRLAKGSAPKWLADSRSALPVVYSLTTDTITTQYLEQGNPIAANLLFLGGVRLGVTLNDIFRKY